MFNPHLGGEPINTQREIIEGYTVPTEQEVMMWDISKLESEFKTLEDLRMNLIQKSERESGIPDSTIIGQVRTLAEIGRSMFSRIETLKKGN